MLISTKGRYAVRIMADIKTHAEQGYVSISDIARRQEISLKYAEQIIGKLVKTKLLLSHRGTAGGYTLGRSADMITLYDILIVTEKSLATVSCITGDKNACRSCKTCESFPYWQELSELINRYLKKVTLSML